jgi:hypothetical protein
LVPVEGLTSKYSRPEFWLWEVGTVARRSIPS